MQDTPEYLRFDQWQIVSKGHVSVCTVFLMLKVHAFLLLVSGCKISFSNTGAMRTNILYSKDGGRDYLSNIAGLI